MRPATDTDGGEGGPRQHGRGRDRLQRTVLVGRPARRAGPGSAGPRAASDSWSRSWSRSTGRRASTPGSATPRSPGCWATWAPARSPSTTRAWTRHRTRLRHLGPRGPGRHRRDGPRGCAWDRRPKTLRQSILHDDAPLGYRHLVRICVCVHIMSSTRRTVHSAGRGASVQAPTRTPTTRLRISPPAERPQEA